MPCRMWKREESLRPIQSHSLSSSVHQGPRGFWYIQKIMVDTSGTLTACPANWRSCGSEKSSKGQNSTHQSQQNIDTDLLRQSLQLKRNYKAIPLSRLKRWRAKDERERERERGDSALRSPIAGLWRNKHRCSRKSVNNKHGATGCLNRATTPTIGCSTSKTDLLKPTLI